MTHKVERSALVMHSSEQMFALVNDVDRYQEFLPWCGGSRVVSHENNIMVATVDIAFKGVRKSFTTQNTQTPSERLDMELVDGPFSELSGAWTFQPISDTACRISLSLGFGFSSKVVESLVGPVFRLIADSMVDSFCKRADQIYKDAK